LPFEDEKMSGKYLLRIYHGLKQTMIPPTILGAFRALNFEFDPSSKPPRLLLSEETVRQSEGFREFQLRDFLLDQLTKLRGKANKSRKDGKENKLRQSGKANKLRGKAKKLRGKASKLRKGEGGETPQFQICLLSPSNF
jgi:hypothetical protein